MTAAGEDCDVRSHAIAWLEWLTASPWHRENMADAVAFGVETLPKLKEAEAVPA